MKEMSYTGERGNKWNLNFLIILALFYEKVTKKEGIQLTGLTSTLCLVSLPFKEFD